MLAFIPGPDQIPDLGVKPVNNTPTLSTQTARSAPIRTIVGSVTRMFMIVSFVHVLPSRQVNLAWKVPTVEGINTPVLEIVKPAVAEVQKPVPVPEPPAFAS